MTCIRKAVAFVVTKGAPRHLLVFRHPVAGIQLPKGTVEQGESAVDGAVREVWEETGYAVCSNPVVLSKTSTTLDPRSAVLLDDVEVGPHTILRGHTVRVLRQKTSSDLIPIRQEIFDYGTSPPTLLSAHGGEVHPDQLARTVERTFVLFVEETAPFKRRLHRADGHEFEVFWTPFRRDVSLVERQAGWLVDHFDKIESEGV